MKHTYQDRPARMLLEPGEGWAEVLEAEDRISRQGADQIKMKIRLWTDKGENYTYEYLTDQDNCAGIIDSFLRSTGHAPALGQAFEFSAASIVGWRGRVKIGIEKDASGQYPDKNKVVAWLAPQSGDAMPAPGPIPPLSPAARYQPPQNPTAAHKPANDDDLPF